jgi:hypothetical protein
LRYKRNTFINRRANRSPRQEAIDPASGTNLGVPGQVQGSRGSIQGWKGSSREDPRVQPEAVQISLTPCYCVQQRKGLRLRNSALLLLCCLCAPLNSLAGHGTAHHSYRSYGTRSHHHGRYKRSTAAKNEFKREHPCPATGRSSGRWPGYVINHVNPLECGRADAPYNMQWQTVAEGKAKDRTERKCRL